MNQNLLQQQYLEAMGIQQWVPRFFDPQEAREDIGSTAETITESTAKVRQEPISIHASASQPAVTVVPPAKSEKPSQEHNLQELTDLTEINDLEQLRKIISDCSKCQISQERTNTVFGVGNETADLMIIGEAPGVDEDQQGEPFVGKAGQLLNKMLAAIGLRREQVFIANILKCRPTNNRDPQKDEIAYCQGYLNKQIEIIQPKVILSVGRISAQSLLGSEVPISKLRGQPHDYGENHIPLVATYHPAYLLRSPAEKAKAWDDLKFVRFLLSQSE